MAPYRSLGALREALQARIGNVRVAVRLAAFATLVACGGCSALPQGADDDLVTGSVTPRPVALDIPEGVAPKGIGAADWVAAKLALDQALRSSEKDISVPWENKDTGVHGTATPIGEKRAGGCRDFMIAVVDGSSADRWVQGEACRAGKVTQLSQVRVLGRA